MLIVAEKPVLKIGHLRITDHLTLGVSKHRADSGEAPFEHLLWRPILKLAGTKLIQGSAMAVLTEPLFLPRWP